MSVGAGVGTGAGTTTGTGVQMSVEMGIEIDELYAELDGEDGPQLPDLRFDLGEVLASIETMSSQRPVAAQIVALTHSEDAGAPELARLLVADAALTGRVFKLANSAYYGLRGRVSSLQFAIAVVGFSTVRSMASVALTAADDGYQLSEDHWTTSTDLALACSGLASRMGQRAQDALCVGLLAQLGVALLHHHDPEGYDALAAAEPSLAGRRRAEAERYGVHAVELTALAMRHWGFPPAMVAPLSGLDDPVSVPGGLLRGATELAERLAGTSRRPVPLDELTCGRVQESEAAGLLAEVRTEAADLRRALVG